MVEDSQLTPSAQMRAAQQQEQFWLRQYSPVIPIQIGRPDEAPIFCVPGAGANVTSFMGLTEMLGDQVTVYGLQPRGLDGYLTPHATVEAAAETYIEALRKLRPHGPYRLLGHSFGGWIALEIARRLREAGEPVETPVVIDSRHPTGHGPMRHYSRVEMLLKLIAVLEESSDRDMGLKRGDLADADPDTQLLKLMHGMKAIGQLAQKSRVEVVRGIVNVFGTNLNTPYAPAAIYPDRVLLVQATEKSRSAGLGDEDEDEVSEERWAEHAAGIEKIRLPGSHMTLLKRPNIDALAAHLWRHWTRRRSVAVGA